MPRELPNPPARLTSGLLIMFTRAVAAWPWASLILLAAVCVVCGVYTSRELRFKNNRADLIDPSADFQQRWLNYTHSFGESSDIVVVVEAAAPDVIQQVLDNLGGRLQADEKFFRNVLFKVEHDALRKKGLQFLSPPQLEMILGQLGELRPVIRGDWQRVNLDIVISQLIQRLHLLELSAKRDAADDSRLPGPIGPQVMQLIGQHVTALSTSLAQALTNPHDPLNPWPTLVVANGDLADAAMRPTYFLNDRGTQGFLQVVPIVDQDGFSGATAAIERLREHIAELKPEFPSARIGLTGIPVLEHDEMARSQIDMTLATIVSFVGVLALMLAGFHGVRHPLIATVMLGVGLVISFAFATATVGHLNILSASFAPILMGLGCDYAIMYLSRYLELRHAGESLDESLEHTSASVGTSILTVAIVTALAFYCATLTKFLGVAELGIISAGGIVLCAIASLFALPPLVKVADRNVAPATLPTPIQGNLLRWTVRRHPGLVAIAGLIVLAYFGGLSFRWESGLPKFAIGYDYNLLNLQADGVESVDLQHRMFRESKGSLLFAVSLADSAAQARELRKQFEELPTVRKVEDLASHFPTTPPEQTKLLIQAVHSEVARLAPVKQAARVINPESVGQLVERLYVTLSQSREEWAQQAAGALDEFLDRFSTLTLARQMEFLNEFQARMNHALHSQLQALSEASDPEPLTMTDFPPELLSRFVSPKGKWLVQVYPKEQIWDIGPLREFVEDVRSIDPEITGTPLQNFEASRQIKQSYQEAATYALVAIWITLLIDLLGRRQAWRVVLPPLLVLATMKAISSWQDISLSWQLLGGIYLAMVLAITWIVDATAVFHSVLALLPSLGGAAIMFGVMRLLHVDLNPANLIVLPLLLGLGMDGGVHVLHDYRLQRRRYRISPSIINSLVLTSTTTMVGFGSLLLAAHRGLYTFGLVLTIGVAASVFVALLPLPAILTLLDCRRRTIRQRARTHTLAHESNRSACDAVFASPTSSALV